jgi:signal peptidase II
MPRPVLLAVALAVAGLLFAADVVSKTWAEDELRRRGARSHLGGHLVLRHQTNSGIAFGVFQPHLHPYKRLWLVSYGAVVTGALAGLLVWQTLRPAGPTSRLALAGVTAMLGGAAGNLRDRVMRGAVIDFIDLVPRPTRPDWNFPAFNLADLYLAAGVVLCAVALLRRRR